MPDYTPNSPSAFTRPVLTSVCGQYRAVHTDGCTHYEILRITGESLGECTWWSNQTTASRIAFEIGNANVRAKFSTPRYPRWFRRRWIECWRITSDQVAGAVKRAGGELLTCYKPGLNCWIHLGFRATPEVAAEVDRLLKRQRGVQFQCRKPRGGWDIECPMNARRLKRKEFDHA